MILRITITFLLFLPSVFWGQTRAKIIGVKDGDTIIALLENNEQKTLRLAEVDCPEKSQPFGKAAKQYTSSQVFGKTVSFICISTDRYKRIIAKVYSKRIPRGSASGSMRKSLKNGWFFITQ